MISDVGPMPNVLVAKAVTAMSEEVSHDDDDMTNVSLYIIPLIDLEVTIVVDPHLASILYSSDEVYNVLGR